MESAQWRLSAQLLAGVFFWTIIFCYAWTAGSLYEYATQGHADFALFYTAGKIVKAGESARLYDLALQAETQVQFSRAAAASGRVSPYMRPPFEALLFLPFVRLPFPRAYLAWVGFNLLLILAAAALIRSRLPQLTTIPAWVYYPAYLAFFPLSAGLALGQDSGLVLLLFAVATVCLVAGHDFRAGCALGLALIKFHLVLPVVFVLLLKRRLRALAGFALMGALLAAVSASMLGVRGLLQYPFYLRGLNQIPAAAAIFPGMMPNLRGLLEGWGSPMRSYPALDGLTAVLSLLLLLWVARQWEVDAPRSKIYRGGLALLLVASVLSGYHTFVYDLSLLCPVFLMSASTGRSDPQLDRDTRRMLVGAAAVLLCAPLYLLAMQFLGGMNVMGIFLLVLTAGWARALKAWRAHPCRAL